MVDHTMSGLKTDFTATGHTWTQIKNTFPVVLQTCISKNKTRAMSTINNDKYRQYITMLSLGLLPTFICIKRLHFNQQPTVHISHL